MEPGRGRVWACPWGTKSGVQKTVRSGRGLMCTQSGSFLQVRGLEPSSKGGRQDLKAVNSRCKGTEATGTRPPLEPKIDPVTVSRVWCAPPHGLTEHLKHSLCPLRGQAWPCRESGDILQSILTRLYVHHTHPPTRTHTPSLLSRLPVSQPSPSTPSRSALSQSDVTPLTACPKVPAPSESLRTAAL